MAAFVRSSVSDAGFGGIARHSAAWAAPAAAARMCHPCKKGLLRTRRHSKRAIIYANSAAPPAKTAKPPLARRERVAETRPLAASYITAQSEGLTLHFICDADY